MIDRVADTITLRDPGSLSELQKMNVSKPKMILAADPTFSLPSADETVVKSALFSEGINDDIPRIAFAIRKWKGEDKLDLFARAADLVYEKFGLTATLIPMEYERDLPVAREIQSRMKTPSTVIGEKHSVFAVIGILSRMKLIVGMRLHALVFGAGQGVPIIGISYDDKVTRFMEYIGEEFCLPYETVTAEGILSCVEKVLAAPTQMEEAMKNIRIAEKENRRAAKEILDRE